MFVFYEKKKIEQKNNNNRNKNRKSSSKIYNVSENIQHMFFEKYSLCVFVNRNMTNADHI